MRSTTILSVRRGDEVAIGGDGQVTMGDTIVKSDARKVRLLADGKVAVGFAGATADAMALLDRFEAKLKEYPDNLARAAIELAKEWRTDRNLRRLESLLVAVNNKESLLVGGSGDVIQPEDGIIGIGSGGQYAVAAARALFQHTELGAETIVREALTIAGRICVYSNSNIVLEVIR
ncbi:MAG: ATP-dependent protease subunit HslV [Planctomycetes bacterium]|nr:ATP-dependent protease subunit HslV [Planctomycetota bacterium]